MTHPQCPRVLLGLFVAVVYRDGLWGVPRWDQLVHLYEASQFDSALEILGYSPSWNRTVSIGDHILFRPFLYLFLAVQQILFGPSFVLWQAAGIALHAAQSVLLYGLLGRASPRTPAANLVVAGLFSSLLISSEMVVWHHITGYILFTVLASLSLSFLLDYLETDRPRAADTSVLLAIGAAFTYELGSVYSLLAALASLASAIRWKRTTRDHALPPDPRGVRGRVRLATMLALVPVLYKTVSPIDFFARLGSVQASDLRASASVDVLGGLTLAVSGLYFWLGGALLPPVYQLAAGNRVLFLGFRRPGGPWLLGNVASVGAAAIGGAGLILPWWQRCGLAGLGRLAPGYAFVLAYASIVSFGRLLPRPASYMLQNLNYAYIAILGVFVVHALALWSGTATGKSGGTGRRGRPAGGSSSPGCAGWRSSTRSRPRRCCPTSATSTRRPDSSCSITPSAGTSGIRGTSISGCPGRVRATRRSRGSRPT
ncbi:MAG: hypothetical protein HYU42_15635 [Candidatus Rokubacteria bacterium]|nr:hypothetical protein [Candidatus Rokubacteria bacterium]MBI3104642.1 hypothetical protein [Candidatus Rokubacteria bacterium]